MIAVTGATGFVGGQLVQHLLRTGRPVRALVRRESPLPREILVRGDLHDEDALRAFCRGADLVIHAAARAAMVGDPAVFHRDNVVGTENVLRAARAEGVRRLLYVSTAGTLGPSDGSPIDETHRRTAPWFGPYESSKAEAEALALGFDGLEVVAALPTRVYGPGADSGSNAATRLVAAYLRGTGRFVPGAGDALGNWVLVDDLVDGLLRVLDRGRPGERYLLGDEDASLVGFLEMVGRVSGRRRRLVHVPLGWLGAAVRAEEALARAWHRDPRVNRRVLERYLASWSFDSGKARRELGYAPVGLEEGLRRTVAWLRANGR